MSNIVFKHNDPDCYYDNKLMLHDCIADKIAYRNGVLQFEFSDGFWITTNHEANSLEKVVRTDSSQVDFRIDNINDVNIHVYTESLFGKIKVEFWNINKLIEYVNNKKYSIEFIYQYRSHFEQMWHCYIRSKKRTCFKDCYIHLPGANAVYKWNDLCKNREW